MLSRETEKVLKPRAGAKAWKRSSRVAPLPSPRSRRVKLETGMTWGWAGRVRGGTRVGGGGGEGGTHAAAGLGSPRWGQAGPGGPSLRRTPR